MKKIAIGNEYKIIGAGGHSKVIQSAIECIPNSFVDWSGIVTCVLQNVRSLVIGVGDNYSRFLISEKCKDCSFETVIHPSAVIANGVEIGWGTVIMANAVVNAGCKIGKHCIINTGAILEHDSVMEDFSSLAPRVVTGGNVKIGTCSAIGIGAVISNKISIGEYTVIGAGAVVVKDIPHHVVAHGVPCRVIRERNESDKYLK